MVPANTLGAGLLKLVVDGQEPGTVPYQHIFDIPKVPDGGVRVASFVGFDRVVPGGGCAHRYDDGDGWRIRGAFSHAAVVLKGQREVSAWMSEWTRGISKAGGMQPCVNVSEARRVPQVGHGTGRRVPHGHPKHIGGRQRVDVIGRWLTKAVGAWNEGQRGGWDTGIVARVGLAAVVQQRTLRSHSHPHDPSTFKVRKRGHVGRA